MVKKKLAIKIGEKKELYDEMNRFWDNPELVDSDPDDVLFLTPGQFSSIFTKSRVATLKTIGNSNPRTMTELVEKLNRPKEAVSRDIKLLSSVGLLEVDQHGAYRRPRLLSRSLSVSF
jgi:predicted transcriptional regulator